MHSESNKVRADTAAEAGPSGTDRDACECLLDELPCPAWLEDAPAQCILQVNNAALAQYGYRRDQFLGLSPDRLILSSVTSAGAGTAAEVLRREKHVSSTGLTWETNVRRKPMLYRDRSVFLVLCEPLPAAQSPPQRMVQLEAINKELEAFAYSVSHDLRAPLRSIRGFSEALLERSGAQLDERGKDYLKRVCDAGKHMERLIEDLLKLSRVTRAELRLSEVDLSGVAGAIVEELRRTHPERQVEVRIETGLTTRGDERLLRVMLDNLLRNAWKFTGRTKHARIEFSRAVGPVHTFVVRDNGVGFEMQYANKLFGVFQRLHSTAEFPGTGVGLATVQRIVNRHCGRVWAEAAVGQGASFYFTLPSLFADEQGVLLE